MQNSLFFIDLFKIVLLYATVYCIIFQSKYVFLTLCTYQIYNHLVNLEWRAFTISATTLLLTMIAGICLLLWAVEFVKKGMTKAFGLGLNKALEKGTSNRLNALCAGMGVTTLLQSANATSLVVSSFAGQGMISLSMALAVMLGANIGTTLVVQFLSLDLHWLMPAFLVTGAMIKVFYSGNSTRGKYIARIFLGLALLFISLEMIVSAPAALKHSVVMQEIFHPLESDPVFALILASIVTWIFHSSMAFVLLALSFVSAGVISTELGFIMVLGANIGSAIAPLVLTSKMGTSIFRVTFGNFLMRLIFVAIILIVMETKIGQEIELFFTGERALVNFHTAFNVAMALLFLPLLSLVSHVTKKMIPEGKKSKNPSDPIYLDKKLLENPSAALSTAGREVLRLADMVLQMLEGTLDALDNHDRALIKRLRKKDDAVDKLYGHIKNYLVLISRDELSDEEAFRFSQTFTFAFNMEHIGDIIEKNLLELAAKKAAKSREFSDAGFEEIREMHNIVIKNLKDACNLFISNDVKMARRLLKEKKRFREAELKTTKSHMQRMRKGVTQTLSTSSIHMDIIRDFKRINSHIAATAYPVLEKEGDVKPFYTTLAHS